MSFKKVSLSDRKDPKNYFDFKTRVSLRRNSCLGPLRPHKCTYVVSENNVHLFWETPKITNGPMKDYEVPNSILSSDQFTLKSRKART